MSLSPTQMEYNRRGRGNCCVRAVMLTFDDFVTGTEQCGGMAKPAQRANAAMTRSGEALAA